MKLLMQSHLQSFTKHPYFQPIFLLAIGAFGVLGFAPFYFYPATIISLIGLCYLWFKTQTPKQAAKLGFIYGLGFYGAGIYWIYISLHTFGNMPWWMAGICTFLLCAFMAMFIAIVGALSVRLGAKKNLHLVLLIAIFWAFTDWIRSWIFTGFPWLTIGYSQVPHSPFAGYMPVVGVYGVSLITVFIVSLTSCWLAHYRQHCAWRRHALALFLVIWIGGSLLKLVAWTTPVGKPISVALLQGNIAQSLKWAPAVAERTLRQYLNMAESSRAKLIVMPETALPILSSQLPANYIERLKQHGLNNHGDILVGVVEYEHGEYFNSMMSIGSAKTEVYRKSHLVPFGEFIPFKVAFGWIYRDWLNMPLSDLSRGSIHQQPMNIAGEKVAINICYEDVFGEEIIRQLPQAGLLINVSNDAWYGESLAAYQHLQFSQARALETGRMMLRATNTGATAIIDTHGNVLQHAPHFTTTILNGFSQAYFGATPYVKFGNWLFLALCALGLSVVIWPKRRTLKSMIKA